MNNLATSIAWTKGPKLAAQTTKTETWNLLCSNLSLIFCLWCLSWPPSPGCYWFPDESAVLDCCVSPCSPPWPPGWRPLFVFWIFSVNFEHQLTFSSSLDHQCWTPHPVWLSSQTLGSNICSLSPVLFGHERCQPLLNSVWVSKVNRGSEKMHVYF